MPIRVNMARARAIHMDVIREARNVELAALDVPYMRAIEGRDTEAQTTIAKQKQLLRDIPQQFDLTAGTPNQLKQRWPLELPSRSA